MENNPGPLKSEAFWLFYNFGNEYCDEKLLQELIGAEGPFLFKLPCGGNYTIELDVRTDFYTINLVLVNSLAQTRSTLGWWDDARWHPFALRWVELEILLRYWATHASSAGGNDAARLLLLARFVGTAGDEIELLPQRRERIAVAYESLGLFSPEERDQIVKGTLLDPPEDDYRWTEDEKLGWVFSGKYACYSIRNVQHTDGDEGEFPFADFQKMMHEVGE